GRRVPHTNFQTGVHSEFPTENPVYTEQVGKLGPQFYTTRCVDCHINNGRAIPPGLNTTIANAVTKVGTATGAPDPQLGSSLQPFNTGGAGEGSISISSYTFINGNYGDSTPYQLRKPNYTFVGPVPSNFSVRNTMPLVGLGLLEAVPEDAITAMADPGDSNADGISGRAQTLTDPETGQTRLGRFGWKAGTARLSHQVASALNADMGVTTAIFPQPDCGSAQSGCGTPGVELNTADLDNLVRYVALLGVAARRNLNDAEALQGETLFSTAGCAGCHTPTLTTSAHHPFAELRSQIIRPYTDLLLHDMGPDLADNLPEADASGAEWRTPPLWSIGLTAGVSGGQEAYLHDGRARNLSEAILWHGGEAEAAREAFRTMSSTQRAALLKFIQSL
ncbi:MAG: c-type cytochrome, partial [Gammaproteobacteria bacterium]|nr:c-type cytochrome [Gammaproteobacteria bacterium]